MREIRDYPTRHDPSKAFWDLSCLKKLLSHNADFSIATSPRNYGKTRAAMDLTMECIDRGENVVWERWDKKGLAKTVDTWKNYHPDLKPSGLGDGDGVILTDESTGGRIYCIPYGLSDNIKGLDIPDLVWEIKDEFIPEVYRVKTRLDREFDASMSVRKTLKRNSGMRSIYLANCIAWQNPYCWAWEIGAIDKGITRKFIDTATIEVDGYTFSEERVIVWENVAATPKIIERNMRSDMAAMSEQEMINYYNNETKMEYTKIEECPDKNIQLQPVQLMSNGYYMSYRIYGDRIYFVNVKPRFDIPTYVSEPQYIDPNKKHYRYPQLEKQFEEHFNLGRCIFDSPKTIMAFQRWMWHCRQRV